MGVITNETTTDSSHLQEETPPLYVLRKRKSRLIRLWGIWQVGLTAATFALSMISMKSFEQRVVLCSLFVGAGFCVVAACVGPRFAMGVALIVFIGALLGPIAFTCSVALMVALVGGIKLKQLQDQMKS
jgi:hypothetical protein